MARRQRSFFLDNKTGKLQSKGKVFVEGTSTHNIAQVKGSTTGNPVALNAIGDDTDIDLRLSAKGNGNIELLSTVEITTGKRIIDSAGTQVEYGDNIEMNSNKITGLGTPTSNTDAATKGYVDSNVSSANDATITLTAGTGLSGSGNFTTDQSADETITLTIDSTVATLTGSQTLTNKTIDSASNTLTLDLSEGTLTGTTAEFNTALSDGSFATLAGTETLTNKTLTSPTINAFSGTGNGSITGTLSIVTTTTDDSLLITTTEDSSSAAPVITLKRNSSSVADADYLGQIKFKGENDADQEVIYAKITAKILDATDGTEDGIIEIAHKKAGSNNISARFRSDSLQLINGTQLTVDGTSTFNGITVNASQTINMGSNRITSVADPVGNQDAATKAYVDANAGSDGGASGFAASTFTTAPGADGDFDLAFNVAQDTQETPFEAGGQDAFLVNLGEIYDMMEPVGSISVNDMGAFT